MADSSTNIANFALAVLGSKRIQDIEDGTNKNARIAFLHYDQAREAVLRRHRWNFALRRKTLSQLATTPVYGYSFQYGMPADFSRLAEVNETSVWETGSADWFELEGDNDNGLVLLTNASNIRVRYVANITVVNRFDALFVEALTILLASKMARAITGSDKRELELRKQYEGMDLPTAQFVDGAETNSGENPPIYKALTQSGLVRARRSYGTFFGPRVTQPTTTTEESAGIGTFTVS